MVLAFSLFLLRGAAPGGEQLTLAEKTFGAALIMELRVPVRGKAHRRGKFPGALSSKALREAEVERVLFPPGGQAGQLPPSVYMFSRGSDCWGAASEKGSLRALVFFAREKSGALRQLAGTEQESGRYTDLHPAYSKLVEAVERAVGWTEERMRAVPAQMLWRDQRAALGRTDNPYLAALAAAFLRSKDALSVVDEHWGAPGTPERQQHEQRAREPQDTACVPAPSRRGK